MGDSIAFGTNVDKTRDVYPKVLERLLQRDYPDKQYAVVNAAVGGYNIWQEWALLKELRTELNIKMVIVGLCLNDSSPMFYIREDIKEAVVKIPARINSISDVFHREFINRLKLYVMVKEVIKSVQRNHPKLFPSSLLWHNLLVKQGSWQNLKDTILEMKLSLAENDIPLVVVIFPYRHQLELEPPDNLIQKDLSQFCQQNGIKCLDLFTCFKAYKDSIVWDAEGIHPDKRGHWVAGQNIYQYLVDEQVIHSMNYSEAF